MLKQGLTVLASGGLALGVGLTVMFGATPAGAEEAVRAPAPKLDLGEAPGLRTAVFAGGCFWGVQGVFQHVKGVTGAVSGFTGGAGDTAHYERVSEGDTGHAEAVRVTFDPRVVSYGDLLRVYFSVITDPTTLNAQGPDTGTQYRSALFPTNAGQLKVAQAYIAQLRSAKLWQRPIVTKIERAQAFYPAEGYHQDYLTLHPDSGYIAYNDLPKVAALKKLYPQMWREKPVLVRG